jgi:hypothetical protein
MANATTPSPNVAGISQAQRDAEIAATIRGQCIRIADNTEAKFIASDEVTKLSASLGNERLAIAMEIAKLSTDGNWRADEIERACKRAAKSSNQKQPDANKDGDDDDEREKIISVEARTDKTVGTFISEVSLFANPKVREKFPTILASCKEAWEAEDAEKALLDKDDRKDFDPPVHKFSKRLYHLTTILSRAVKKGKLEITSAKDVVDYCVLNDPDFDVDRVAKRIEGVAKLLGEMHRDFGFDGLKTAISYIQTIEPKDLQTSREAMLAAQEAERQKIKLAPVPAVVKARVATVVKAPVVVAPEITPEPELAEGVFDTLDDDILDDDVPTTADVNLLASAAD